MSNVSVSSIDDEWWTTAMVCSYLKLKRRASWDIRRDPAKAFPAAVKPGGKVNLFRAEDVRIWVAKRRPTALPSPVTPSPVSPAASAKPQAAKPQAAEPPPLVVAAVAPIRKPVPRRRAQVSDERQLGLF